MSQPNPEWYDALQTNPFKETTFTDQLAYKVKRNALAPGRNRSVPHRLAFISAAIICVLGIMLIVSERESVTAILKGDFTSISKPNTLSSRIMKTDQVPTERALTDSDWEQLINERETLSHRDMLYKQSVGDNVTLVFSRRINDIQGTPVVNRNTDGHQAITLAVDYFEWNHQRWEWSQGVTYSLQRDRTGALIVLDHNKEIAEERLVKAGSGVADISLFYGMVVDPSITQIRITDNQQVQQQAVIIPYEDGYTYWFAAKPNLGDGYQVEGLDAAGNAVTTDD